MTTKAANPTLAELRPEDACLLKKYAEIRRSAESLREEAAQLDGQADQIESEAIQIVERFLNRCPSIEASGVPPAVQLVMDRQTSEVEMLILPTSEKLEAVHHIISVHP